MADPTPAPSEEVEQKYYVTYGVHLHPEGLPKSQIPEGCGACDAILIGSILLPEDGSYSQMVLGEFGKDGRPLTSKDVFKFWSVLATHLSTDPDLDEGRRALCYLVHLAMKKAIAESILKDAVAEIKQKKEDGDGGDQPPPQ